MSRQHKVVHVTCVHRVRDPRIFEKECRSLAAQGHDVVLVAPHDRDEMISGVRIRAIPKAPNRPIRMLLSSWRALYAALTERGDVYHLHDPELLMPFQIARLGRAPIIFDMHENLPKAIVAKDWISAPLRPFVARIARALQRLFLGKIPVIFAENSYQKDYPWIKRWATVLNYPTLDILSPSSSRPDSSRIAYLGSITPQRGLNVTLEALRQLSLEGRRVTWELIGGVNPDHADFIRAFAKENDLTVNLHGYLPLETACPIVSQCSLGLALLQPLPNYVDSYPTKIFDYMAMGLPVLCSDFPLYRRVVDDAQCGRWVDPTRPDLVARAIADLLDRPEEASRMGARGLAAVRHKYDWESQALRLLDFYGQILPQ